MADFRDFDEDKRVAEWYESFSPYSWNKLSEWTKDKWRKKYWDSQLNPFPEPEPQGHGNDQGLTAVELRCIWGVDGHPTWTLAGWRDAVRNKDTQLGYWDWVADQLMEYS